MAATFTVDAFPGRTFPATLTKLKLNPTNSNGVVTYQAVLSLENTDKLLIPGMTAYVSLLIEERKNVVKVERGQFLEAGGGNYAYFVVDGVAERRKITTGAISLDAVEILSGAQVGERIVVTGADAFGDAQRVRIAD